MVLIKTEYIIFFLVSQLARSWAFLSVGTLSSSVRCTSTTYCDQDTWQLYADAKRIKDYISEQYPTFYSLILSKNEDVWKKLSDADTGCTIFAPSNEAMQSLGDKKIDQLRDIRNEETAQKMAAFHAVNERVTAEELFNSGGVVTIAGVVDVGRSVKGGFFGFGGSEDGGVTIGGAKVTSTFDIEECLIHEVDNLISPQILWRYCDQLRIPGSK